LEISADAWMTPDDILEIGCRAGILHRILARAMCTDYVADFVRAHRGAGDVTTLVRQDAYIGNDGYTI
jgi:hypothetical protein